LPRRAFYSYPKGRGESLGLPVGDTGLVERAERLVISLVAAGLAGLHTFGVPGIDILLPIALWIVAAGSLVTLIQRVVTVRRESAEADAAEAAAGQPAAGPSAAGPAGRGSEGDR
ncbi:CDP-alcohol phosphatidyltransferase family protein, partial [Streptomyces anulatus]